MADQPAAKPPVESIPSVAGGISAVASANAPFIYFDHAPTFGFRDGIANITLEAVRHMPTDAGTVAHDRAIVAHLRMSATALQSLKAAIEGIELPANPAPEGGGGKPN